MKFKVSKEYTEFGTPSNIPLAENLVNLQLPSINVNAARSFHSKRKRFLSQLFIPGNGFDNWQQVFQISNVR